VGILRVLVPPPRHAARAQGAPLSRARDAAILSIAAGKELCDEAVGFARNAAWLQETYGYRFLDPSERIRARYYALLIDPERTPGIEDHYVLREKVDLPGQFGAPVRVRVYARRDR
jgi:hypothetical protein